MSTMEGLSGPFASLPYFSPLMMTNRSETSAARRLLRCAYLGVYANDISLKFQRPPENAPDLSREDFYIRKSVVDQVARWCESMQGKKEVISQNEWTPILYQYEIVSGAAERIRDWGHLVFTDGTISRFLLVMLYPAPCNCGNYSHNDYDAMTRHQADRFMSLLTYLHEFGVGETSQTGTVHATYLTPDQNWKLSPNFLSKLEAPSPSAKASKPPIFHILGEKFLPALTESELEKINNVATQGRSYKRVEDSNARQRVLGSLEPKVGSNVWMEGHPRQCTYCEKVSTKLQQCSRCKLAFYCNKECQRMAWPTHKHWCRKGAKA